MLWTDSGIVSQEEIYYKSHEIVGKALEFVAM